MADVLPFPLGVRSRLKFDPNLDLADEPVVQPQRPAPLVRLPHVQTVSSEQVPSATPPPGVQTWALQGRSPYDRFEQIRRDEKDAPRSVRRHLLMATGQTSTQRAWQRTQSELLTQQAWYKDVAEKTRAAREGAFKDAMTGGFMPDEADVPQAQRMPVQTEFGRLPLYQAVALSKGHELAQKQRKESEDHVISTVGSSGYSPADFEPDWWEQAVAGKIPPVALLDHKIQTPRQGPTMTYTDPVTKKQYGGYQNGTRTAMFSELEGKAKEKTPPEETAYGKIVVSAMGRMMTLHTDYDEAANREEEARDAYNEADPDSLTSATKSKAKAALAKARSKRKGLHDTLTKMSGNIRAEAAKAGMTMPEGLYDPPDPPYWDKTPTAHENAGAAATLQPGGAAEPGEPPSPERILARTREIMTRRGVSLEKAIEIFKAQEAMGP